MCVCAAFTQPVPQLRTPPAPSGSSAPAQQQGASQHPHAKTPATPSDVADSLASNPWTSWFVGDTNTGAPDTGAAHPPVYQQAVNQGGAYTYGPAGAPPPPPMWGAPQPVGGSQSVPPAHQGQMAPAWPPAAGYQYQQLPAMPMPGFPFNAAAGTYPPHSPSQGAPYAPPPPSGFQYPGPAPWTNTAAGAAASWGWGLSPAMAPPPQETGMQHQQPAAGNIYPHDVQQGGGNGGTAGAQQGVRQAYPQPLSWELGEGDMEAVRRQREEARAAGAGAGVGVLVFGLPDVTPM